MIDWTANFIKLNHLIIKIKKSFNKISQLVIDIFIWSSIVIANVVTVILQSLKSDSWWTELGNLEFDRGNWNLSSIATADVAEAILTIDVVTLNIKIRQTNVKTKIVLGDVFDLRDNNGSKLEEDISALNTWKFSILIKRVNDLVRRFMMRL